MVNKASVSPATLRSGKEYTLGHSESSIEITGALRLQFERRYHFAKYCAKKRFESAPNGKRWEEVFQEKEGLSLAQFKAECDAMREKS